ncbi:hypothetical protein ScPMuIL_001381 [Solemya velum]
MSAPIARSSKAIVYRQIIDIIERIFSRGSNGSCKYRLKSHTCVTTPNTPKSSFGLARWSFCLMGVALVPTVQAFSFGLKRKEDKKEIPRHPDQDILENADDLYSKNEVEKLFDYLIQFKDSRNDEIQWRLARAACDKGKVSEDPKEKRKLTFEAFEYAKSALAINNNNFAAHKWFAVLLDYTGEYEGTKQRISNAYQVKEHFMKAVELNPRDATSIHSLGYWCYLFADMPWYQRKIAGALFATPPTSTYKEALKYFLQAEAVDPNFYSMNLMMLGKTYSKLGNHDMARVYLIKARDFPVRTPDDQQAHKEASSSSYEC